MHQDDGGLRVLTNFSNGERNLLNPESWAGFWLR